MQKQHMLGNARTDTGYYTYWSKIKDGVNRKATYAFWSNCKFHEQRNVMQYHTGTLYNQKHAKHYGWATDISCPLCPFNDSALHILSGCQHTKMKNMITERHNVAARIIIEALSRGSSGVNLWLHRCWQSRQVHQSRYRYNWCCQQSFTTLVAAPSLEWRKDTFISSWRYSHHAGKIFAPPSSQPITLL